MPLSPVFEFADRFVDEQSALDPIAATGRGVPGFDHLLTDLSPEGYAARADHTRQGWPPSRNCRRPTTTTGGEGVHHRTVRRHARSARRRRLAALHPSIAAPASSLRIHRST
jgi:hypothetical protein